MPAPARTKWWDDVVSVDTWKLENGTWLLWGDRVRVLDRQDDNVKVFARNTTGWVPKSVLGGEPLLELYFIDVGQGDGVLVVTPEGHHLMVDGGLNRTRQQTGKSAADFVDWKFHKDYLHWQMRSGIENHVYLDALIVSHADLDHYGGISDLIDRDDDANQKELDTLGTRVQRFFHPGLAPQYDGPEELGPKKNGRFISLLDDRADVEKRVAAGSEGRLRGYYRDLMKAALKLRTAAGDMTPIERLSHETGFLPGFAGDTAAGDSRVSIKVLGPVEEKEGNAPALQDIGSEGENKNGHSVVLRLDYKDRRFLLTGDLNDRSHRLILDHYGTSFEKEFRADVAKACHHGSHHVDFRFLQGVNALSTVFSSGDANTYDHPRAWVLGAAALSGRVVHDTQKHRLKAPLVYSTEVARSLALKKVDQLLEYDTEQRWGAAKGKAYASKVSGDQTLKRWRTVLDRQSTSSYDWPPVSETRTLRDVIYGLVNVRSDGKRLLFAVRNEGDRSWACETLEEDEIASAVSMVPAP